MPIQPIYLRNLAKWAELAGIGPQDFDFFNNYACETFILAEIHYYLSGLKVDLVLVILNIVFYGMVGLKN